MKPLFNYTDFRTYLSDWIQERKEQGLPGSNRWFAMKMQINSTSWLTSVLNGKKGLSKETANKLSVVLKHTPVESHYFETLVHFNLARTVKDRNFYFDELSSLQKLKEVKSIAIHQYGFYSEWYHTAVRSLIGMFSFTESNDDIERLTGMVVPSLSFAQVKRSIRLLLELELIKKNEGGVFELTSNAITTGENVKSLAITNFQQEAMRLAQESFDRCNVKERYIGTVTVGISEQAYRKIRQLLIDTSNKIAEIADADNDSTRVYQINFQAFPMSVKQETDTGLAPQSSEKNIV